MYPNPQDALPLPSRPSVEQYKKLAKDLVKSCRSGDPAAVRVWTVRWIEALAALQRGPDAWRDGAEIGARAEQVEQFARKKLSVGNGRSSKCALADAQFVIARAHGFLSWSKFVTHIESLARAGSALSAFETAAYAVVTGDVTTLERLLHKHPQLIRARSTREHRAKLLHYVSANGIENYRQVTPKNIAEITEILLAAGAEVDAEADVYGGGCTTLGLVATSAPPAIAGVQQDEIDVLLKTIATLEAGPSSAEVNRRSAIGHVPPRPPATGHVSFAAAVCRPAAAQIAVRAGARGSGPRVDRRIPRRAGDTPWK